MTQELLNTLALLRSKPQPEWEQVNQPVTYTFDGSLMRRIAEDFKNHVKLMANKNDVRAEALERDRLYNTMRWDKAFVYPLAVLTDMMPDSVQRHAAVVNDWLVSAREYTRELRQGNKPSVSPGADMTGVISAALSLREGCGRAWRQLQQASIAYTLDNMNTLTAGDGGIGGVDFNNTRKIGEVLSYLGMASPLNASSILDIERALERHSLLYGDKPIGMLSFTDPGIVFNNIMNEVNNSEPNIYYPGAWDGCSNEYMHELAYRWFMSMINQQQYALAPDNMMEKNMHALGGLAKRRPHIYPVVLGVHDWLRTNYLDFRPYKFTALVNDSLPPMYKKAEDMAAVLAFFSYMLRAVDKTLWDEVLRSEIVNKIDRFAFDLTVPVVVTDEDRVMIECYAKPRDILRNRRTELSPGRFIKRVVDNIDDTMVKYLAETLDYFHKPLNVEFISDLEPKAWSKAYMNSHGFRSCMTPDDRDDSVYLAVEAYAARAYATSEMREKMYEVALAVLRHPVSKKIVARSIVNKDTKRYVRVYGDDRLAMALTKLGYEEDSEALSGCHLYLEPAENVRDASRAKEYYCPYLDGRLGILFDPDDGDTWEYSASKGGVLVTMLDSSEAISLIESGYEGVYRGNSSNGTLDLRGKVSVYEFEN